MENTEVVGHARVPCLRGRNDHLAILWSAEVGEDAHQMFCLSTGLLRLGNMQIHLVPVEIRVVRAAHALVEAERPAHRCQGLYFLDIRITAHYKDLSRNGRDEFLMDTIYTDMHKHRCMTKCLLSHITLKIYGLSEVQRLPYKRGLLPHSQSHDLYTKYSPSHIITDQVERSTVGSAICMCSQGAQTLDYKSRFQCAILRYRGVWLKTQHRAHRQGITRTLCDMMDTRCSEGCRLNSTISPFSRCRSTVSPTLNSMHT